MTMSSSPTRSSAASPTLSNDPPPIPPRESSSSSSSSTIPSSPPPNSTGPSRLNRKPFPTLLSSEQINMLISTKFHKSVMGPEVDPYAYREHERNNRLIEEARRASAMPEQCLTFCSQRADAPPMCRMFCLRKRKPLETREEQLARLRPPKRQSALRPETDAKSTAGDHEWEPASYIYPSSSTLLPPVRPAFTTSTSPESSDVSSSSSSSTQSTPKRWSPFEALRRRVEPYSFVYVRGAPEGPVGRYMEELEFDDGHNDFGMASRGAGETMKRKRYEPQMEFIDWGEEGSILHLPFTSVFGPIIAIPANLNRIFSPAFRFLSLYRDSFTSGGQTRNLERFQKEISEGSAFTLISKIQGFWAKRVKEKEDEMERQRAQDVGKGQ